MSLRNLVDFQRTTRRNVPVDIHQVPVYSMKPPIWCCGGSHQLLKTESGDFTMMM
jgi:hypothetical protein